MKPLKNNFSLCPPNLHEYGIVCFNNGINVINTFKPLEYCVPHGQRVGYWKLKKIKHE